MQSFVNSVFIHIAKTAGMTISSALKLRNFRYRKRLKQFDQNGNVTFGHLDYAKLLRQGIVSKKFNDAAYKFTFVRNPFDRAVSNYFWHLKKNVIKDISFKEFSENLNETKKQIDYIKNVTIDFIGRYENLLKDINHVSNIIGVKVDHVPVLNKIHRKPYKEYYTKEITQNIYKFYKDDFEAFGYDNNLLY